MTAPLVPYLRFFPYARCKKCRKRWTATDEEGDVVAVVRAHVGRTGHPVAMGLGTFALPNRYGPPPKGFLPFFCKIEKVVAPDVEPVLPFE